MDKINPNLYITDNDPVDESAFSISNWFETKTQLRLELSEDQLAWHLAQGWEVTDTNEGADGEKLYSIRRRAVKEEQVLDDLVASYVTAYNEGRDLNDTRYDNIIAIYTALVDKSEDDWNSLESDDSSYDNLIEAIITALASDYTTHASNVGDLLDDFGASRRTQIGTQFDNKLTSAEQSLVRRGMYNSTIWDSISAGIERERALALSDLEDKISAKQLDGKNRLYEQQQAMRGRILAARDRLRAFLNKSSDRRIAERNALVKALTDFMERRTDGYPNLSEIGQLASVLGLGSASSYVPTT